MADEEGKPKKKTFFKRFLGSKSEITRTNTSTSEQCQEFNVKSKNTPQIESAMSSNPHGNLSLFSGMTFSSSGSNAQTISSGSADILDNVTGDEQHEDAVQGIQESQQLKEVFEKSYFELSKGDAEIKESVFMSENENEHKTTQEKEHRQEPQAIETIPSGQQAKKKKRTQAKRPGYARDNTNISHPKPEATGGGTATTLNPSSPMMQKTCDVPIVSGHMSKTEKTEELRSCLPSQDEPGHGLLDEDQPDNAEEKSITEGTQNIIDTPSSSEENLFDIGEHGSRRNSSEQIQEETEPKENLNSINKKTGAIYDLEMSEKDFKLTRESEDSTVETNYSEEDGIVSKEDIPVTPVMLNKEKDQTLCEEKASSPKEESQKESDQTYDFQLDSEDKSLLVEQDMQFRISGLRDKEEIIQELEHESLQNYSNLSRAYLDKEREMENLTQEENSALANDNYDLAEELSVKIEELTESLEKAKYKLPAVDSKVQQVLQLRSELSLKRLSILHDTQVTLEELREEQASSLEVFSIENTAKIYKTRQSLNTERLRLDRAHAHLKLDTEHLKKEETMLEDEMHQRTGTFVQRKELLIEERENIREEIAEVERKLEQLRISESQCSKNIEAEKLKIKEIIEEFLPQKEPLDIQRKELEDQHDLLNTDQESLDLAQESLDKLEESWSNKKQRITELLNGLQTTINTNSSSIDILEKQRLEIEEFHRLNHLSITQDSALENLKLSVKQRNQQIKSLTSKINLSERNIAGLTKKVAEFENQISDRNEAKDIAKKERNFKEAKRLKEETETLKDEGIVSQGDLERLVEELNQTTLVLQTNEKELKTIKKELEEKERESDLKLVDYAAKVIKGLQEQITRYVDNEFLHTLLTAEITTCQNLINELCSKHSISAPVIEEAQLQYDTMQSDEFENINQEVDETSCSEHDIAVDEAEQVPENEEMKQELLDQLDELEGKLEAVVDMEDFDEADRIQQEIIQLKSKLEERS